jgi:hypothetical protein
MTEIEADPLIPVKNPETGTAAPEASPPTVDDLRRLASHLGPQNVEEARLSIHSADELERLNALLDCLYDCHSCRAHFVQMGPHDCASECAPILAVIRWNDANPPGTKVAIRLVEGGPEYVTQTRSKAWTCSGGAIVLVEGRSGGHSVAFLRPLGRDEKLPPMPAKGPVHASEPCPKCGAASVPARVVPGRSCLACGCVFRKRLGDDI